MISYVRMTQGKIFKVRDVASVVGQVISLTLCVARIMTRALYTVVNKKQSWKSKVEFTKGACDELTFWIGNVDSLNFRCPWLPFQSPARLSILTHQITLVVLLLKTSLRFFIKIGVLQRVLKALLGESLGL